MNNTNNHKPPIRAQKLASFQHRSDVTGRVLTFAPMAWLKLRLFLHADDVEVGGFGISSEHDLLYIENFVTVKQIVTIASVEFDDNAVADHFDRCADEGVAPSRCGRVWIHTHPGSSPCPSFTDEKTFERVFGSCDWAVMAIVARTGATYGRLRFSAGPGGETIIPLTVDWERYPKDLLDQEGKMDERFIEWMDEYGSNIHHRPTIDLTSKVTVASCKQPQALRDQLDELDDLYDRQVLTDDYSPFSDPAATEEVYPWS
jgi:hypothetical protein